MENYFDQATVNPPHGEKGDFRKITVTLPPGAYNKLIEESARRKIAKEPNQLLSALLREAVTEYLRRFGNGTPDPGSKHA
jgi:hypothetical protein